MSGATNRRKGHDTERMVAKWLRDNGFPDAYTTRSRLGHDGFHAPGDVVGPVGIVIECKHVAASAWPSWVRQAVLEAGPDRVPVVVRRTPGNPNVGEWVAVTPWLPLLGSWTHGWLSIDNRRRVTYDTSVTEDRFTVHTEAVCGPLLVARFASILWALDAYPVEVER